MKLTTKTLKKIIKEELETVLHEAEEQKVQQAVDVGEDMVDTPVGDVVFKALDNDPKFQAALKQAMSQMNEEENMGMGDVGGQYAAVGGMAGMAAAAKPMQVAFWSGVLTKSLAPAALGVLKAIGIASGGLALGAVAGYLIYKGLMAATKK